MPNLTLQINAPESAVCMIANSNFPETLCFTPDAVALFTLRAVDATCTTTVRVCVTQKATSGLVQRYGNQLIAITGPFVFERARAINCTLKSKSRAVFQLQDNGVPVPNSSVYFSSDAVLDFKDGAQKERLLEKKRERAFRALLLQKCCSNRYLENVFSHIGDYRVESFSNNVFGQPLSIPFCATVDYLATWVLSSCALFVLVTGFDVCNAQLRTFGYAEGCTLYCAVLALALGPYHAEGRDCNSSAVIRGMRGNDCNHQSHTACELHRLCVVNYHELSHLFERMTVWDPIKANIVWVAQKAIRWAWEYTTGIAHMPVVYSDGDLKFKGRPFDNEQERELEFHQGLFLDLKLPRPSGIVRQYAEVSGMYECGPEVCQEWFWGLFKWSREQRPAVGYCALTRFDQSRYKSVLFVNSKDKMTVFLPRGGDRAALPGWSFLEACCAFEQSSVAVAAKRPESTAPELVLTLDNPFVSTGFSAVGTQLVSAFMVAPRVEMSSDTVALPWCEQDGVVRVHAGPGAWKLCKVDTLTQCQVVPISVRYLHTIL